MAAVYLALDGDTRRLTMHLHSTWLPAVVLRANDLGNWVTIDSAVTPDDVPESIVQRGRSSGLLVPAIPYKQEWPIILRRMAERSFVFTLAEAWQSKYFTAGMFVAIDAALEGRNARYVGR